MSTIAKFLIGLERFSSGLSSHETQVEDHHIAYLEGGQGDPILLLHGFGASGDSWTRFAKPLTKSHRVIAPDLPGWGRSTRLEKASYGYPAQVERVHKLVQRLGLSRFHLVGHSMGGFIASAYAATYPKEVSTLGLLCAHGVDGAEESELMRSVAKGDNWLVASSLEGFNRLLGKLFVKQPYTPKIVLHYLAQSAVRNCRQSQEIFDAMQSNNPPLVEMLPKIQAPTLVIWGDKDMLIHVSCAEVFKKKIPSAQVRVLPETGHMPLLEHVQEAISAYASFLESAGAPAAQSTRDSGEKTPQKVMA